MEITSTSHQPFEKLALDIVGPLPLTFNGKKYILTMQDDLTKFSYAIPLESHETKLIADELTNFISLFGIPQTILTDQGTEFNSNLIKELTRLFKIKHLTTTAYHPQTNGALERSHSTLKDYIKHFINSNQTDWDDYVPLAMFNYNTLVHSSTKFTPFELIFGHKPILPSSITSKIDTRYTYNTYHDQLKYRLNKSYEIAQQNLKSSKETSKQIYDKKLNNQAFKVNDSVYLLNETTKPGHSKKLTSNYNGPYIITDIHSNQNATIKINRKFVRVHFNRLKLAFPGTSSPDNATSGIPLPH